MMQNRIVFNGKEYAGIDAMPEDVRQAFLAAVAQLGADADGDRVPDVFEGKAGVVGLQQSSISVNGRTVDSLKDLPAPLQMLLGYALREAAHQLASEPTPPPLPTDPFVQQLDATSRALKTVLYLVSIFAAAGLATIGIWIIVHMDAGSRSQGGAFYVGIGVVLALVWLIGSVVKLVADRP
jgi:hypothetical protein